MSVAVAGPIKPLVPVAPLLGSLRRFSVDEYHRMIESEILTDEDKVELLNGYVVLKMPKNPPHESSINAFTELFPKLSVNGWTLRVQSAVTLVESEPEPDFTIARGSWRDYRSRHPSPADIGMLIEVADSSLSRDRDEKGPIYADAGIAEYWIVNLVDRQVEVYSSPSGPIANPSFLANRIYRPGDSVPLILDGKAVGLVLVDEILP